MGDPPPDGKVGGLLLLVGGTVQFVDAAVALRVAAIPKITPVPGAPPELAGVAMNEGAILAVVSIGTARTEMIVCQHAGDLLGIVGGTVLCTGSFDAARDGRGAVEHGGEAVPSLDVAALYERVMSSARAGRWGG